MSSFVNPYTFVGIGESPNRQPAPGHDGSSCAIDHGDVRVSGAIDVQWTLRTPMLLPATAREEGWVGVDARLRVPGSSLKGSVRSLHEAMFNGCLRAIDEGFVPGYRAPATADSGWRLAILLGTDSKGIYRFQLCTEEDLTFIEATSLARKWPHGRSPRTGEIVQIGAEIEWTNLNRWEISKVEELNVVTPTNGSKTMTDLFSLGDWIFLVTDLGARHPIKRNGSPGRCFWAGSRLSSDTVSLDPQVRPGAEAMAEFEHAVAGSEDRRILEREDRRRHGSNKPHIHAKWREERSFADVEWQGRKIGVRARHTGFLFRGDVVWVKADGGQVTKLKLSQIWRTTGTGAVGARLNGAEPCLTRTEHHEKLCLSCATFGAADTGGSRRGKGEQIAYAGHVRFGTATSIEPVRLQSIELAPLSAPHPGNGMFYLELPQRIPHNRNVNDIPTRWGSSTDARGSVPLRGRKFYWHSDPSEQVRYWENVNGRRALPRYEATAKQRVGDMSRAAELVPAGTVLRATVTVDGLPRRYALALLLALEPGRLAAVYGRQPNDIAVHLGGGKPFGLGTALVTATAHLHPARLRYTESQPDLQWPSEVTLEDLDDLETLAGGGMRAGLPSVMRLLDVTGLEGWDHLVAYPPGAEWSEFGTQEFRTSYKFFTVANGERLRQRTNPWHPLPHVHERNDQLLPLIWRKPR